MASQKHNLSVVDEKPSCSCVYVHTRHYRVYLHGNECIFTTAIMSRSCHRKCFPAPLCDLRTSLSISLRCCRSTPAVGVSWEQSDVTADPRGERQDEQTDITAHPRVAEEDGKTDITVIPEEQKKMERQTLLPVPQEQKKMKRQTLLLSQMRRKRWEDRHYCQSQWRKTR